MRLSAILLLAATLHVSAAGFSQQVTLHEKEITLDKLFSQLRKQTGYNFFYSNDDLEGIGKISVAIDNLPLKEALLLSLKDVPLTFSIVDKVVLIKKREDKVTTPAEQPPVVITGKITNKKGEPINGATIWVKGTKTGAAADRTGQFTIEVPDEKATLVISSVSYKTQELQVGKKTTLYIVLEEEVSSLNDVVVNNGYFQRQSNTFTGSVATYSTADLRRVGNKNVLQSLAILDPSFVLKENLQAGSDPNKLPDIQLRGQTSLPDLKGEFTGNPNNPLFILDGFETTVQKVFDLDMNLVESVTLLKDATAKAIYGAKAANGVVVIETKRPKEGALRVSYNGSLNLEAPDLTSYHLTNSFQKLEAEKLAGRYSGVIETDLTRAYSELLKEAYRGVNTYWLAQPLQVGKGQNHGIFMDGGDKAMRYSVNLFYRNTKGVMIGSDRTTLSGAVNLQYRYKSLSFRNNLSIDRNKGVNSPYGSFGDYAKMNPYWRIHDSTGALIRSYRADAFNPLYNASLNTKDENNYTTITENFYTEWAALENLRFTARVGITQTQTQTELFLPAAHTKFMNVPVSSSLFLTKGEYTQTNATNANIVSDLGVSYSFRKGFHQVYSNAIFNIQETKLESSGMQAVGFPNPNLDFISAGTGYLPGSKPTGNESTSRNLGVGGAVNYSYDNRYLADFTYRASASSQFGANNRWGSFWSAGIGWNVKQEAFMRTVTFLDQLRLRASTGYTGSQNFSPYQSLATYQYNSTAAYNGDLGETLLGLPNPDLKWQQTQDNNIGIDLGFFKRLNLHFEYYTSVTNDLLSDITTAPSVGFSSYKENIGKTENKGFQLGLNYQVYKNPAQRTFISVFMNVASNKNKIRQISNGLRTLNEQQDAIKSGTSDADADAQRDPSTRFEEGQSMTAIWAVRSLGIDPSNGKEIFVKKDGTRTYVWSPADQVVVGDALPAYNGNIGANIQFKGITANFAFTYRLGGQQYNSTLVSKVENADLNWNVDERVLTQRWQTPGQQSLYKDIADNNPTRPTSRFVQDLNELIFSSVSVGYDFTTLTAVKSKILRATRFSFNMNELGRISSVQIERGLDYPFARIFSFSISTTF